MPEAIGDPKSARERIEALEGKGDFLIAYDLARSAAEAWHDQAQFAYLAVRNLARCGATSAALVTLRERPSNAAPCSIVSCWLWMSPSTWAL